MYSDTYKKLRQYAALYPDNIEALTFNELDFMDLNENGIEKNKRIHNDLSNNKTLTDSENQ